IAPIFFFFFQAEDGIRDFHVTGVQTCALPILPGVPDVALFPRAVWARLQGRRWRQSTPELLTYAHGAGYLPLRRALAEHLRLSRSVKCRSEEHTSELQSRENLVCRLLLEKQKRTNSPQEHKIKRPQTPRI